MNQYDSKLISSKHCYNLRKIIDTLLPPPKKEVTYPEMKLVDEEVSHVFRNWKNSRIYK